MSSLPNLPRARFRPMTPRPRIVEVAFWLMVVQVAVLVVPPITFNIGVLIFNAAYLWVAWRVRNGASWARVIRSIVALLGLVWVAVSISGVSTAITTRTELITYGVLYALDAAAVVLLWLPSSNAYFPAVAAEKRNFRETMLR